MQTVTEFDLKRTRRDFVPGVTSASTFPPYIKRPTRRRMYSPIHRRFMIIDSLTFDIL